MKNIETEANKLIEDLRYHANITGNGVDARLMKSAACLLELLDNSISEMKEDIKGLKKLVGSASRVDAQMKEDTPTLTLGPVSVERVEINAPWVGAHTATIKVVYRVPSRYQAHTSLALAIIADKQTKKLFKRSELSFSIKQMRKSEFHTPVIEVKFTIPCLYRNDEGETVNVYGLVYEINRQRGNDFKCVECGAPVPNGTHLCEACESKVPDREPLWCEECQHFCNVGMDGEGECDVDNLPTWYANHPCHKFERKEF